MADDSNDEKGRHKRLKELQDAFEVNSMEPSERYRALMDVSKHHSDLMEASGRTTRFALVILAALNTVNVILLARPELLTGTKEVQGIGTVVYGTLYAGLSLYLCIEAIGVLKPRLSIAIKETTDVGSHQKWLNLLSLDATAAMPPDDYYELWRTAQFGQLNREIAFRNQTLARMILVKYGALRRLFNGLTVQAIFTVVLILYFLYSRAAY